jgi:hypothetical protein
METMAAEQESRAQALQVHSAAELAGLLDELADADERVARTVDRFLARRDPSGLAKALRAKLTGLRKRRGFVRRGESRELAHELQEILDDLERVVLPADPHEAFRLLARFLETDEATVGRADDSDGCIGDTYRRACRLLARASTAAGHPLEAEKTFHVLIERNHYGTRDRLCDEAAGILAPAALERLVATWQQRMAEAAPTEAGGLIRLRRQLAAVARSMGDPVLHEQTLLKGADTVSDDNALAIARTYLVAGQPERALEKMPASVSFWDEAAREALLLEIHQALGDEEAVKRLRRFAFSRTGSPDAARAYLESLPADEREAAREALSEEMRQSAHPPLCQAKFFAGMDDVPTAAAIIEAAEVPFDGDHYPPLLDLLKVLSPGHPLAATILTRALLEATLARGLAKYYTHAARYAKQLSDLAPAVADWKGVTPHPAYWHGIEQRHARKSAFWARLQR